MENKTIVVSYALDEETVQKQNLDPAFVYYTEDRTQKLYNKNGVWTEELTFSFPNQATMECCIDFLRETANG